MNPNPLENDKESIKNLKPQIESPNDYTCPISGQIFFDPVILSDNRTYERECAIRLLSQENPVSPITKEKLDKNIMLSNMAVKNLTELFLIRNPQFRNNVYAANPILQAIQKSLIRTTPNLDATLAELIINNPISLAKLELGDLENLLKQAYKNYNFVTFFAILSQIKIPSLLDTAKDLMTTPFNEDQPVVPNVFYRLASLKELPIQLFDMTLKLLGKQLSKIMFETEHDNNSNIFHIFWMNKHFAIADNILAFLSTQDRKKMCTAKVLYRCDDGHDDDNDTSEIHTHSFSSILEYMLGWHPHDNITETLELLKRECSDQIETMLLTPCNDSHVPQPKSVLLQLWLTAGGTENAYLLTQNCSQKTIEEVILKSFQADILYKSREQNSEGFRVYQHINFRYTNLVQYAHINHTPEIVIKLLHLLKDKAIDALLCPWIYLADTKYNITFPNAIQYFYYTNNIKFCDQLCEAHILTFRQILTALIEKNNNMTILNHLINKGSVAALQDCINKIGNDKSKELLLETINITFSDRLPLSVCGITQAIMKCKISPNFVEIVKIIIPMYGEQLNELLKIPPKPLLHIFYATCYIDNAALTEFILNHFSDIDLMIKAIVGAVQPDTKIPPKSKMNFIEIFNKRICNILSTQNNIKYTILMLINFAIDNNLVDLLKSCIINTDKEQLQKTIMASRHYNLVNNTLNVQANLVTFIIVKLYVNNNPIYFEMLKILLNCLDNKAQDALLIPYQNDKKVIHLLCGINDQKISFLVLSCFDDLEKLHQFSQNFVITALDFPAKSNILEAIQNRIDTLARLTTSILPLTESAPLSKQCETPDISITTTQTSSIDTTISKSLSCNITCPISPQSEAQLAGHFLSTTLAKATPSNKPDMSELQPRKLTDTLQQTISPRHHN